MNTTTIFLALVIVIFFIGCNNELNLMDSYDYSGNTQSNKQGKENMKLLWKLDEICVRALNEMLVENKAIFVNQPFNFPADYLIVFDSYTNAGKFTNGYIPLIRVSMDEETMYEAGGCPEANPEGICHREVTMSQARFNNLCLYIAIYQGDGPPVLQNDYTCTLKLSNIMLYKLN